MYHKSHWSFQVEIAKELYNRGNHITFQLAEEFKDSGEYPPINSLSFATIRYGKIGFTPEDIQIMCKNMTEITTTDFIAMYNLFNDLSLNMGNGFQASLEYILKIKKEENITIDVFIGDSSPSLQGACGIFNNTKCIITSPFISRYPDSELIALGKNSLPPWFPNNSLGFGLSNSLFDKLKQQLSKIISYLMQISMMSTFTHGVCEILEEYNVNSNVLTKVHPSIINTFQGFDWNIPLPPHVKYIGPVNLEIIEETRDLFLQTHNKYMELSSSLSNEELLNEFTDFDLYLEENNDIIVISFGKSVELSQEQVNIIIEFARLISPIPILWTIRERHISMLSNIPDNLRIETWVNLIGVLAHPNTNLLISQCGVATAHEAILTQTPLLCIPFLYDQFEISVLIDYHNLGEVLDKGNMTPETLKDKIRYMIPYKSKYQEKAQDILKIAKLKPSIPQVVDWIETIADIGEDYFLSPIELNKLYFYEYHELFYISYLLILLFSCLCCFCCCFSSKKTKIKQE